MPTQQLRSSGGLRPPVRRGRLCLVNAGVNGRPAGDHLADRQRVVRRLAGQFRAASARSSACASSRRPAARGPPGPTSAPPAAAPAAWSAACGTSRSRVRSSNSARVSGTVSILPAWVTGDARLLAACSASAWRARRRPAAAASDCGSLARVARRSCFRNWSAHVFDDAVVPVLAAQPHVALDGQRLEPLAAPSRTSVTSKVPPPRS